MHIHICLYAVFFFFFNRSASFSQATRSSLLVGSDSAVQKLTHGFSHCLNGMGSQHQGFYSLPKPSRQNQNQQLPQQGQQAASTTSSSRAGSPREASSCYVLPRGYSSEGPGHHGGLGFSDLELDGAEEVYAYKTPCNAPLAHERALPDNYDRLPTPPGSFYQTPRAFDKNHNALPTGSGTEAASAGAGPPPRPPKPGGGSGSQGSDTRWGSPQSLGGHNGEMSASAVSVIPRRNTLPAVENIRLHRGGFVIMQCIETD